MQSGTSCLCGFVIDRQTLYRKLELCRVLEGWGIHHQASETEIRRKNLTMVDRPMSKKAWCYVGVMITPSKTNNLHTYNTLEHSPSNIRRSSSSSTNQIDKKLVPSLNNSNLIIGEKMNCSRAWATVRKVQLVGTRPRTSGRWLLRRGGLLSGLWHHFSREGWRRLWGDGLILVMMYWQFGCRKIVPRAFSWFYSQWHHSSVGGLFAEAYVVCELSAIYLLSHCV